MLDATTGPVCYRSHESGAPNPYVPGDENPLGMVLGPLAVLVLVRGKRKGGKIEQFLKEGTFRDKKLVEYNRPKNEYNFIKAREIINVLI